MEPLVESQELAQSRDQNEFRERVQGPNGSGDAEASGSEQQDG
jgi:hypothetical protein